MRRRGFDPVYDRGQLLVDLAVALILGAEAIGDFQGLRHLAPVIGPVPSTPTVWRALSEIGPVQLGRLTAAVTSFRRSWWGLLAARPEGFPWLGVGGRELTGITVVDLGASIVPCASEKENAVPTYKGGIGFCPNLATCDNTDEVLALDPRPGNATANCAADNIALLDCAVSRLPGRFRHRLLVRLDGAGFSHELLAHIAAGGGMRGRHWEFFRRLGVHRGRARCDRRPARRGLESRHRPVRDGHRRHLRRRADRSARPRGLADQDPRAAGAGGQRAAAPALPQAGQRAGEATRSPVPADRHQ